MCVHGCVSASCTDRTDNSVVVPASSTKVRGLSTSSCLSSKHGHSLSYKIRRLDFHRLQDYTKEVTALPH